MDWNRVEGNWKEFRGKVKERLQQRYGFAKDQVRKDIDSWFSTLK
jgi:uncharacterized protein YjbJ (UPF0337 family)